MKNLILTLSALLLSISLIQAQEVSLQQPTESGFQVNMQNELHIKLKDGAQPDIYVDGKKFDFPMDLIDKNRIKSIDVLKGDLAMEKYGSKNGVLLITTKEVEEKTIQITNTTQGEKPMIIINEKKSSQGMLEKLSPDDIENISILKGNAAITIYGPDGSNGVIVVKTKKGKKEN